MLDHAPLVPTTIPLVTVPQETPASTRALSVLHIVNGEHFAGAERVQSHLGRCLPQFGVTADFALVKPGRFAQMIAEHDGRWGLGHATPMANRFDLRPAWRIRDLVREHNYELLHAHTPRTALIAQLASKLTGVPWVYHIHSPAARDSMDQWSNRINAAVERQVLRGCAHLIAVSESLRLDCVSHGVDDDSVSVVHNGVPSICPPRNSVPAPNGRWTLGMIALMRPRKGLEVLLEAIRRLDVNEYNVVLRVIGPFESVEYEEDIEEQIDRLKIPHRIDRVGFVEDVPATLAQLDALVLPSLCGEGLPMVVLEAMAAGLPVIATRVEGTPEAITHGVEGLLAEPRDAGSLAKAIGELVSGRYDWHQLAQQARARHARCFSDLAMARGVTAVYRKLLG